MSGGVCKCGAGSEEALSNVGVRSPHPSVLAWPLRGTFELSCHWDSPTVWMESLKWVVLKYECVYLKNILIMVLIS